MASNTDRLAFIGMGNMGVPMALNLQNFLMSQNRPPLVVYNRTLSKTAPVVEAGASAANSLAEVVENANIIFSSMANDQALEQTYKALLEASDSNPGKEIIFIDTSTVYPTTISAIADKVQTVSNRFMLHCPLWGPPTSAASAQLIIITSGNRNAIERVKPYLRPVLGKKIIDVGEDVSKAATFKLTGNFFITGILELLSEGMTLAQKTGLGKDKLMEFIDAFFPFGSFQIYGRRMQKDTFTTDVGFTTDNAMKDIRHMRRLAEESGVQLPTADLAFSHLISAKANGGADYDWSCIVGALRTAAGLPFVEKSDSMSDE